MGHNHINQWIPGKCVFNVFFCIWYHYYISHHVHFPSDTAHLTMVRGCSSMAEISLLNRKNNIICNELNMCYLCIFPQVLLPLFNGKFMFFSENIISIQKKNHVNINSLITCDTMGLHFYMSLEKEFDYNLISLSFIQFQYQWLCHT